MALFGGQGWTTTHEYVGTHSGIEGLLWDYSRNGWNIQQTFDGPYARMVATRGGRQYSAASDYYYKFTITKETLQKAIWTLPDVAAEMDQFVLNTGLTIQDYKVEIESAVSDGDEDAMENAFAIFYLLILHPRCSVTPLDNR